MDSETFLVKSRNGLPPKVLPKVEKLRKKKMKNCQARRLLKFDKSIGNIDWFIWIHIGGYKWIL